MDQDSAKANDERKVKLRPSVNFLKSIIGTSLGKNEIEDKL
ncbi:hypothetical protein [Aggregatibacter actinomycetemcomitans]|nr:hypothetical protein [Aggregatibacter actinomycetemcomitans]